MPKIAEILGCKIQSVGEIFNWIGVEDKSLVEVKQIADESIGEIIEYGQDRYNIKVTGKLEGNSFDKIITVDGPTLMNQKAFYDAVVTQAQVWMPRMKVTQFEEIMRMKFESRVKSKDYVEEANEDLKFSKYFENYIKQEKLSSDRKELFNYQAPYYNQTADVLEFNLNNFETYLKVNGKYKEKSLVYWKIESPEIEETDIIEGEVLQNKTGEGVVLIDDFEKNKA